MLCYVMLAQLKLSPPQLVISAEGLETGQLPETAQSTGRLGLGVPVPG